MTYNQSVVLTAIPSFILCVGSCRRLFPHWVVVKGAALFTRGEEEASLTENQSTYIPLGVKHRLENPGKADLELIEVQPGSYLGEDDFVRFEDIYERG